MSQPSPAERLRLLPAKQRDAFIASLSEHQCEELLYDWRGFLARPAQLAPDGDWDIWLVLAGRGFGKTRLGAEWVREQVERGARRIALVAETQKDLEEVMIEGDSGLLSVFPPDAKPDYRKKPVRLTFKTGAIALGYNATEPNQLRGPQFDAAWCDELAKWRYARETWDQLQFGLRLGDHPKQVVTTTPRPIELVKAIVGNKEGRVHLTRGQTSENKANLASAFLKKIENRYSGTRLGRQELLAEILSDDPYAMWKRLVIDRNRVGSCPSVRRTVVAVDPPATSGENADECGISVSSLGLDEHYYVLHDGSCQGLSPEGWASRVAQLYGAYDADCIVAEVNNGGDMVASTIRHINPALPVVTVHATRGKVRRAEPIATMYERGIVHHVGNFGLLEDQMCDFTSDFDSRAKGYSPDRVDSLVWGLTELSTGVGEMGSRRV